jgi:hypothetical protein
LVPPVSDLFEPDKTHPDKYKIQLLLGILCSLCSEIKKEGGGTTQPIPKERNGFSAGSSSLAEPRNPLFNDALTAPQDLPSIQVRSFKVRGLNQLRKPTPYFLMWACGRTTLYSFNSTSEMDAKVLGYFYITIAHGYQNGLGKELPWERRKTSLLY